MRREHNNRGELTRFALSQGFSQSVVTLHGSVVTMTRDGRGSPYIVTVTDLRDTTSQEFKTLSAARMAFEMATRKG